MSRLSYQAGWHDGNMAAKEVAVGGSTLLILRLMHLLLNIDSRINWINTKGSVSCSPLFCYLPLLLVVGSKSVYVILSNPTSKKHCPRQGKIHGHLAATFLGMNNCLFPIALGYISFCFVKKKKSCIKPKYSLFWQKVFFVPICGHRRMSGMEEKT